MMVASQISTLINEVWDGVERSKAGKITGVGPDGKPVINHVGFNTFLAMLNSLTPKNISSDVKMKE